MSDFMYEGDAMQYPGGQQETPPEEQPPVSKQNMVVHTLFDYVELFVVTVAIILFATLFLFRHAIVDGDSMYGTLKNGEHLIISDLFYTPKAGDIVVFESEEETGISGPIIKRVIATEGDVVTIYTNTVYVNGERLTEPYANLGGSPSNIKDYLTYGELHRCIGQTIDKDGNVCYSYEVGEGELFVMGDNRFNSTDSRKFGTIDEDCVLGRVLIRIAPLSAFGGVD